MRELIQVGFNNEFSKSTASPVKFPSRDHQPELHHHLRHWKPCHGSQDVACFSHYAIAQAGKPPGLYRRSSRCPNIIDDLPINLFCATGLFSRPRSALHCLFGNPLGTQKPRSILAAVAVLVRQHSKIMGSSALPSR